MLLKITNPSFVVNLLEKCYQIWGLLRLIRWQTTYFPMISSGEGFIGKRTSNYREFFKKIKEKMSSIPCYPANVMAIATTVTSIGAVVLAFSAFFLFVCSLHKDPTKRFIVSTPYDIEGTSWILAFTAIGGIVLSSGVILNYHCGENCPSVTLACTTLTTQYGAYFVSALTSFFAAGFKIASIRSQIIIRKALLERR